MSRNTKTQSGWLDVVAGLLAKDRKNGPPRLTRRLTAERLERRMVLSTAGLDDSLVSDGLSLADYLAEDHPPGPIAPSDTSDAASSTDGATDPATTAADQDSSGQITTAQDDPSSSTTTVNTTIAGPVPVDHFFGTYAAGEGEGEGGGSGSGSGGGSGSGSGAATGSGSGAATGSGSGAATGSGSGAATGSGSGAGTGSGSGSGSGDAGGSGSGSGEPDDAPTITGDTTTGEDGSVTISGGISDDSDLGDLTVNYDGPGTFSLDADGNFTVNMGTPEGSGIATISVTDPNGQTTIYTYTWGS